MFYLPMYLHGHLADVSVGDASYEVPAVVETRFDRGAGSGLPAFHHGEDTIRQLIQLER
jgi:hypothetical protein